MAWRLCHGLSGRPEDGPLSVMGSTSNKERTIAPHTRTVCRGGGGSSLQERRYSVPSKRGDLCTLRKHSSLLAMTMGPVTDCHRWTSAPRARTLCQGGGGKERLQLGGGGAQGNSSSTSSLSPWALTKESLLPGHHDGPRQLRPVRRGPPRPTHPCAGLQRSPSAQTMDRGSCDSCQERTAALHTSACGTTKLAVDPDDGPRQLWLLSGDYSCTRVSARRTTMLDIGSDNEPRQRWRLSGEDSRVPRIRARDCQA